MIEILNFAEQEKRKLKLSTPKNKLSVENRLLMILKYWKNYNAYRVIGIEYEIHHTSFISNATWVENILIKRVNFHVLEKKVLLKNQKDNSVFTRLKNCYRGKLNYALI